MPSDAELIAEARAHLADDLSRYCVRCQDLGLRLADALERTLAGNAELRAAGEAVLSDMESGALWPIDGLTEESRRRIDHHAQTLHDIVRVGEKRLPFAEYEPVKPSPLLPGPVLLGPEEGESVL